MVQSCMLETSKSAHWRCPPVDELVRSGRSNRVTVCGPIQFRRRPAGLRYPASAYRGSGRLVNGALVRTATAPQPCARPAARLPGARRGSGHRFRPTGRTSLARCEPRPERSAASSFSEAGYYRRIDASRAGPRYRLLLGLARLVETETRRRPAPRRVSSASAASTRRRSRATSVRAPCSSIDLLLGPRRDTYQVTSPNTDSFSCLLRSREIYVYSYV